MKKSGIYQPRGVKEISNAHLESQILELTKFVLLLTKEKGVQPKITTCGLCTKTGHPTDMCAILQEDTKVIQAMVRYQPQQRQFDQPHKN